MSYNVMIMQVCITSEDNRTIENKVLGRKILDKLYKTYPSELSGKKFAYDGEKCLYTVGPLPKNKYEFMVVLEDSYANRCVNLFIPTSLVIEC